MHSHGGRTGRDQVWGKTKSSFLDTRVPSGAGQKAAEARAVPVASWLPRLQLGDSGGGAGAGREGPAAQRPSRRVKAEGTVL